MRAHAHYSYIKKFALVLWLFSIHAGLEIEDEILVSQDFLVILLTIQ